MIVAGHKQKTMSDLFVLKESISLCNDILDAMFEGMNKSEFVFTSTSKDTAIKSIDDFYNFVDMTMS